MTPREKLRQIIEQNPNADRSVLRDKFRREVMHDPDLQRAVVDEVGAGLLNEMLRSQAN